MQRERLVGGEAGDLAATREVELVVELADIGEGDAMAEETGEEDRSSAAGIFFLSCREDGWLEEGELPEGGDCHRAR